VPTSFRTSDRAGQDRRHIVLLHDLVATFAFANQWTLTHPANLRLGRIERIALGIAAPYRLRPFFTERPEDRDHSRTSQLVVSRTTDLDRDGVILAKMDVQCGQLLRCLAISRLTRITSASAWRSPSSEALRTIDANCRSYFSRRNLAIILSSGQVVRSIPFLHDSLISKKSLPPRSCAVLAGEGPTAFYPAKCWMP